MGADVPSLPLQGLLTNRKDPVRPSRNQRLLGLRRAQTHRHHPTPRSWLGFAPTLDEDASKANRVRHWHEGLLQ